MNVSGKVAVGLVVAASVAKILVDERVRDAERRRGSD
jgi:hypothetical protein